MLSAPVEYSAAAAVIRLARGRSTMFLLTVLQYAILLSAAPWRVMRGFNVTSGFPAAPSRSRAGLVGKQPASVLLSGMDYEPTLLIDTILILDATGIASGPRCCDSTGCCCPCTGPHAAPAAVGEATPAASGKHVLRGPAASSLHSRTLHSVHHFLRLLDTCAMLASAGAGATCCGDVHRRTLHLFLGSTRATLDPCTSGALCVGEACADGWPYGHSSCGFGWHLWAHIKQCKGGACGNLM